MCQATACHIINDLDGLCAGVLVRKCFNIPVKYTGYGKLNAAYNKLMTPDENKVIITDISLTEEQYEKYRYKFERGDAVLLDHHDATEPIIGKDGVVFDEQHAGSSLAFVWLLENYSEYAKILLPYKDFVWLTRDYDLWKHEDWRSSYWNALLVKMKFWNVEKRFMTNPSAEFNTAEQQLVDELRIQREETKKYIKDNIQITEAKDGSHKIAVMYNTKRFPFLFEELSEHAKKNHELTLIIWNDQRSSMRSTEIDINKSGWGKYFRGHALACGSKPEKNTADVLDYLVENYYT